MSHRDTDTIEIAFAVSADKKVHTILGYDQNEAQDLLDIAGDYKVIASLSFPFKEDRSVRSGLTCNDLDIIRTTESIEELFAEIFKLGQQHSVISVRPARKVWRTITLGEGDTEAVCHRIATTDIKLIGSERDILHHTLSRKDRTFTRTSFDLVEILSLDQLDLSNCERLEEIHREARNYNLSFCPPEVVLHLLAHPELLPHNKDLFVATQITTNSGNYADVIWIRRDDDYLTVFDGDIHSANWDTWWSDTNGLMFVRSR